jgi:hypothetical protein
MRVSSIFRLMGVLTALLGVLCVALDRWLVGAQGAEERQGKADHGLHGWHG